MGLEKKKKEFSGKKQTHINTNKRNTKSVHDDDNILRYNFLKDRIMLKKN